MIKLKKADMSKKFGNSIFESIAVGRAYELLRHDLMVQLKELQNEMHFKYCRFHGLFHDEMAVVRRLENGRLAYQWHYIDKITDNLLSVGLKPFFELNGMPKELASGDSKIFWWEMNTSEPKDYAEWGDLVEHFVSHMVDRYGLEEVKSWYFEVWNEPNLEGFWPAGMERYYKLYKYSAEAVKRVSSEIRVGGPATAGGAYIAEMIDYCAKNNVPIDFITTHAYPIGEYCEYKERKNSPYELGDYFAGRFKEVKEQVLASEFPELEIHWTEWNTQSGNSSENISWICNPTVDMHFGGACVVRNMIAVKDLCNSAAYWVVSDLFEESGMPHSVFSCTYGLMNIHGIKKATYNAYKLLRKMRGNIMESEEGKYPLGCVLAAAEENGIVRIIACNQQLPEIENQPDWNEEIYVPVSDDGEYIVTTAKIEKGQGSCYEIWLEMGAPQNISKTQEELLRFASMMKYDYSLKKAENSAVKMNFTLRPDEVIYMELQKQDIKSLPREMSEESLKKWNENLMIPEK